MNIFKKILITTLCIFAAACKNNTITKEPNYRIKNQANTPLKLSNFENFHKDFDDNINQQKQNLYTSRNRNANPYLRSSRCKTIQDYKENEYARNSHNFDNMRDISDSHWLNNRKMVEESR